MLIEIELPHDLATPLQGISQINEIRTSKKYLPSHVCFNIIQINENKETTIVSSDRCGVKGNMVCVYIDIYRDNGLLFS